MEGKVLSVIVTFDGTKYCYIKLEENGKRSERVCCEKAKEVLVEGVKCTVNGFTDTLGFLMECEGVAECREGALIVRNT